LSLEINGVARTDTNIFGFDFSMEEAAVVVLPFSWDVSCSFERGTRLAPEAILTASTQLDFYNSKKGYREIKIFMEDESSFILDESKYLGKMAEDIYSSLESGRTLLEYQRDNLERINERTFYWLSLKEKQISNLLKKGKKVILLGGEHTCTLAYLNALNNSVKDYGILQIDAHMDMRDTYAGFKYSHASVLFNALESVNKSVVQVGIRDCAPIEVDYAKTKNVKTYFNLNIKERLFAGESWESIVGEIISMLPSNVYLTMDIDGLDPSFCPNTGTPVPGGLSYDQCIYLINRVSEEKNIIGADIVEVGSSPYDANVASRILWAICTVI